jgi:transcriptional regulator with XRE-family HTH domain
VLNLDSMVDISEAVRPILAEIRSGMKRRSLSGADLASAVGISSSYFESWLSGTRRLAASRVVLACREVGIPFRSVAATLDLLVGDTNYLRISRAARPYICSYCDSAIDQGNPYVRLEPFGPARQTGAPVLYFCRSCSNLAGWIQSATNIRIADDRQLLLPLAEHVKETRVQLIDVSSPLLSRLLNNPDELHHLNPSQFEEFVLDRLHAMGLKAYPVGGGTFRRDGGIDIIFTPAKPYPFPFLGAVQVKHRRDPHYKLGPDPLRELLGVMAAHRLFSAGMIVTNTSFTPDAKDFAMLCQPILRLRDFKDLTRWVAENFADDAEWREMPKRIQLCEGVSVDLI